MSTTEKVSTLVSTAVFAILTAVLALCPKAQAGGRQH